MKVKDLISYLETQDPEADVYIMSQPKYPFEYGVAGVCRRADFADVDFEEDTEVHDRWTASQSQLPPSDVFLLEGAQLRYGSGAAWDATR